MAIENRVALIAKQFKEMIEKKYTVIDMKLFGSSARGDSLKSSDIDIWIKLSKVNRNTEEDLFDMAYDLELEHDCLIDVVVVPEDIKNDIPLYQNIAKEGITI